MVLGGVIFFLLCIVVWVCEVWFRSFVSLNLLSDMFFWYWFFFGSLGSLVVVSEDFGWEFEIKLGFIGGGIELCFFCLLIREVFGVVVIGGVCIFVWGVILIGFCLIDVEIWGVEGDVILLMEVDLCLMRVGDNFFCGLRICEELFVVVVVLDFVGGVRRIVIGMIGGIFIDFFLGCCEILLFVGLGCLLFEEFDFILILVDFFCFMLRSEDVIILVLVVFVVFIDLFVCLWLVLKVFFVLLCNFFLVCFIWMVLWFLWFCIGGVVFIEGCIIVIVVGGRVLVGDCIGMEDGVLIVMVVGVLMDVVNERWGVMDLDCGCGDLVVGEWILVGWERVVGGVVDCIVSVMLFIDLECLVMILGSGVDLGIVLCGWWWIWLSVVVLIIVFGVLFWFCCIWVFFFVCKDLWVCVWILWCFCSFFLVCLFFLYMVFWKVVLYFLIDLLNMLW